MKKSSHLNILLVEILVATLFFALASTVILRVYAATRSQSSLAEVRNTVQTELQNLSAKCYAAEDVPALLAESGYTAETDSYVYTCDDYTVTAVIENENTEAGVLRTVTLTAFINDEPVLTLPSTRYLPEVAMK